MKKNIMKKWYIKKINRTKKKMKSLVDSFDAVVKTQKYTCLLSSI